MRTISTSVSERDCQGLKDKFCKAEQDCFGAPETDRDSLKVEDLRFNKTTGKLTSRI